MKEKARETTEKYFESAKDSFQSRKLAGEQFIFIVMLSSLLNKNSLGLVTSFLLRFAAMHYNSINPIHFQDKL